MEQIIQLNANAKLSEHFTLGEFTKSGSHPEVYNIPTHEAIANIKRLCGWLEVLRKRYNELNQTTPAPSLIFKEGNTKGRILPSSWEEGPGVEEIKTLLPIIINSGYRSPQLNKKVGGASNSNHLTGCACDIRTSGMEQAIQYAAILIQYADESHQDFDELLIERNLYGAIWLHFAVRPKENRRKINFINA